MGLVELVLDLVEALPFLGFDISGILPGESYNRNAIKLSGAVPGEW